MNLRMRQICLVARDLAGPTPQLALDRLRKAVFFAQIRDPKALVDSAFQKEK